MDDGQREDATRRRRRWDEVYECVCVCVQGMNGGRQRLRLRLTHRPSVPSLAVLMASAEGY
jgi:hypothetical protein